MYKHKFDLQYKHLTWFLITFFRKSKEIDLKLDLFLHSDIEKFFLLFFAIILLKYKTIVLFIIIIR